MKNYLGGIQPFYKTPATIRQKVWPDIYLKIYHSCLYLIVYVCVYVRARMRVRLCMLVRAHACVITVKGASLRRETE